MPLMVQREPSPTQSTSGTEYDPSDALSDRSTSSVPTYTYDTPQPSGRSYARIEWLHEDDSLKKHGGRSSTWTPVDSYTSTISSTDDNDDLPPLKISDYNSQPTTSSVFPATPREFADYFPSSHRLSIRHDDTTDDGNMNLRVDTVATPSTEWKPALTLFHLRMYDLKDREFSLRRYSRDSGNEVCHTRRKYLKPSVARRPVLQRSVSNALSNLRPKSDHKTTALKSLQRQDSGYDSMSDEEDEEKSALHTPSRADDVTIPSNTITVDFSNYAHLEVNRRGAKSSKRYDFEYWGTKYSWKRATIRSGSFNEISYHLVDNSHNAVAHIVPVPLSNFEARDEEAKGGWVASRSASFYLLRSDFVCSWVPPCSMWISDDDILNRSSDVAE